jgi:hypothetical protein
MTSKYILQRLSVMEGLLRERRFDIALAIATKLDATVADLDADPRAVWRVPATMRERIASTRWAAEVGCQLHDAAGMISSHRRRTLRKPIARPN